MTGENYSGDIDDALTSGVYWCTAAHTTNRPTQDAGSLWVGGKDQALFASQLFVTAAARHFFRSRANGTWSSWVELAAKSNMVPGKIIHLPNPYTKLTLTNFSTNYPVLLLFGVRSNIILGSIALMGVGSPNARIETSSVGKEDFSVSFSNETHTGITITFNDKYAQVSILSEASYNYTFS